jgi:hypothetical protein
LHEAWAMHRSRSPVGLPDCRNNVNSPVRTSAIGLLQHLQLLYLPSELDITKYTKRVYPIFDCNQTPDPVLPTQTKYAEDVLTIMGLPNPYASSNTEFLSRMEGLEMAEMRHKGVPSGWWSLGAFHKPRNLENLEKKRVQCYS